MPIITTRHYEPRVSKIESEADLVRLMKDIRREIGNWRNGVEYSFEDKSLTEVLDIVDSEKFRITVDQGTSITEIDFHDTRQIIADYVIKKHGACISCKHLESFKPVQDETCRYCGLHEKEDACPTKPLSRLGYPSPRVDRYGKEGCGDEVILFDSLKRVLEEAEVSPGVARTI